MGNLLKKIIFYEYLGFGIIILFLWIDEVLDIPHIFLGAQATPINYIESIFETLIISILAMFIICTTMHLLNKIEHLAMHDSLTNLINRRFLMESLKLEISRSSRSKSKFSIILGDIDFFKAVNDQYGHDCGDKVLQQVAHILRENLRSQDLVSRWGGEEFLIILPDTSFESAKHVAEKIRSKIEDKIFSYEEEEVKITMSFGISIYDHKETAADPYIRKADKNLYKAKQSGRNMVV